MTTKYPTTRTQVEIAADVVIQLESLARRLVMGGPPHDDIRGMVKGILTIRTELDDWVSGAELAFEIPREGVTDEQTT